VIIVYPRASVVTVVTPDHLIAGSAAFSTMRSAMARQRPSPAAENHRAMKRNVH